MKKTVTVFILGLLTALFLPQKSLSQLTNIENTKSAPLPAACRTEVYLPLLKGKRMGIFANNTATIENKHQ